MSSIAPSIVRTVTPIVVGAILALLAQLGFTAAVDEAEITAAVQSIIQPIVMAVYYAVIRYLETFRRSSWGKLLGQARAPDYYTANFPKG